MIAMKSLSKQFVIFPGQEAWCEIMFMLSDTPSYPALGSPVSPYFPLQFAIGFFPAEAYAR